MELGSIGKCFRMNENVAEWAGRVAGYYSFAQKNYHVSSFDCFSGSNPLFLS
jgi:hypothetical protein